MTEDVWIVIPGWDKFQHYKDRQPAWIKNYPRLLHDPNYLELTHAQRGVLHGLWMLYAASGREVRGDTAELSRALNGRTTSAQLEALNHAGFIELSASTMLAPRALAKRSTTCFKREAPKTASGAASQEEIPRDPDAARKVRDLMGQVFGA